MPEVFGVRLPTSHSLTNVDFDLVPNKPPPNVKQYEEEVEEIEEEGSDEESDTAVPGRVSHRSDGTIHPPNRPFNALPDADMAVDEGPIVGTAEGSDAGGEDDDGLFGADDDSDNDEAMESVPVPDAPAANGIKRKLVEEEDYD